MPKILSRLRRLLSLRWLLLLVGVVVVWLAPVFDGLAPTRIERSQAGDPVDGRVRDPRAPVVILISVDGLAPYVMQNTSTPVLDRLAREGTRAGLAETIQPSITMPSHASMISGVGPDMHGVDWNRYQPWSRVAVQTIFSACGEHRLRCGLVAGKVKFAHFVEDEPGADFYAFEKSALEVFASALSYLKRREPDFLMLHLAEVDIAGHAEGWGSGTQRMAIRTIDLLLGEFLASAHELGGRPLQVILTADHGGHERRHNADDPRNSEIPWIAWGAAIAPGRVIEHISILDTAHTIFSLLGIPISPLMQGKTVPLAP